MRMHTHACKHMLKLYVLHALCMFTHTRTCVHMLRFQKLRKTSFYALKMDFGTNPTSSESRSKPLFYHYIKAYIVAFQNTENPKGKHKIH